MELKRGVLAKARRSSRGQTMTEYSMIVLVVGVAAYSAYAGLGVGIKAFTQYVTTFLAAAVAAL